MLCLLGSSSAEKAITHAPTGLGAQEADGLSRVKRVKMELEKQYEAGMRIKHEGRRKGSGTKSLLVHSHEAPAATSMYLAAGSHNVPVILAWRRALLVFPELLDWYSYNDKFRAFHALEQWSQP